MERSPRKRIAEVISPASGARHIIACDGCRRAAAVLAPWRASQRRTPPSRDRASQSIGSPGNDSVDRRDMRGSLFRRRQPNRDDVGEPLPFRQDVILPPLPRVGRDPSDIDERTAKIDPGNPTSMCCC